MKTLPRNAILPGDARTVLASLLPESVDCVVTSPPYFRLRDYGAAGQLGQEATVEEWVANLRAVMRGVGRVLKPHGSVWLNVADGYSRHPGTGVPPKGMLLAPERLALALAADGWLVRNKVVWAKPNPLPQSAVDRLSPTYEVVFLLTKQPDYFFDLDAIRVPHRSTGRAQPGEGRPDLPRRQRRARHVEGHRPGRAPERQEPGRRLDARHPDLPRRPLRDLPGGAGRTADPGHLPGADLRPVRPGVEAAGADPDPAHERGPARRAEGR